MAEFNTLIDPLNDPYAVLGLESSASDGEIRKAYFGLVRLHPPEKDPDTFRRIRAAYDQINAPDKRVECDRTRIRPWTPPDPEDLPTASQTEWREDVLRALESLSEIHKRHFREDFKDIQL